AIVKQIGDGVTFMAKGDSGHWVSMDGPQDFGGSNAASRPKELLLFALGGCTGSDVAAILRKKRVPLQGFEMQIKATQAEEHPQVYTDIHIEYVFYGEGVNPADIERAIELSTTKYCSVSAMLRASVTLTHSYRIEQPALAG
ncbi:MAG: OsmC/Ohr family protein, partial [Bacteroidetes bacterium]|nr:OsmC/Ohr family protein [Bacteroidota bacterium]